jgi:hypothetical protein
MGSFETTINQFIQQTCVEFVPCNACNNNQYFTLVNDPSSKLALMCCAIDFVTYKTWALHCYTLPMMMK